MSSRLPGRSSESPAAAAVLCWLLCRGRDRRLPGLCHGGTRELCAGRDAERRALLLCHRPGRDSLHPQQMVPRSLVVTGDWGARGAAGSQELTPGRLCSPVRHSPRRVLPGHPLPSPSSTAELGPGPGEPAQSWLLRSAVVKKSRVCRGRPGWDGWAVALCIIRLNCGVRLLSICNVLCQPAL